MSGEDMQGAVRKLALQLGREEEVINASKSNFIRVHLSWKEWREAVVSARCCMGPQGLLMNSFAKHLMFTCNSLVFCVAESLLIPSNTNYQKQEQQLITYRENTETCLM